MSVISRADYLKEFASSSNGLLLLFFVVAMMSIVGYHMPALRVGRLPKIKLSWLIAGGVLIRMITMLDSFWYDEAFTGAVARLPLADLHRVVIADVHPPTWYALSHIVGSIFGYNDLSLRLPAFGFGMISIVLAYLVARNATSERTAITTVIILLYLPNHIFYSSEARQYTLLACAVLLGIWAVQKRMSLIPFIAILPYLHSYGFIYMAIIALYAVIKHPTKMPLVGISVAMGMTYLPIMLVQSGDVANGFWLPPYQLGQAVTFVTDMIGARVTPAIAVLPFSAAIGLSVWGLWRWQWRSWGVPLVAIGVPLVAIGISLVWHNIYLVRALLPAQILLVIIWANGLSRTSSKLPSMALMGAVVLAIATLFISPDVHKPNWRGIFDTVCDAPVFATSTSTAIIALYYTGDVSVWHGGDDLNQQLTTDAKMALGMVITDEPPRPSCVVQMTNSQSSRTQNKLLAQLDIRLRYERQRRNSNISVYGYYAPRPNDYR